MSEINTVSNESIGSYFNARLFAELEDLKTLTGEEIHRYGGSIMDKNLLVHEIEKAVERNSTREEFWEKLRTLTFAIFTFAEQVLILCRPLEPNYLVDDSCQYRLAG